MNKFIDKEYVDNINYLYNNGEKISRNKNIFYRNLQYTLNSNVHYVLNHEEKIEWAKCYSNIEYFIEKYLEIKLRPYQKEWIKAYKENRFNLFCIARQTGLLTILSALNLHSMIFENKHILLIPCKYNIGNEFIDKIKIYYFKIPYFLKPNITNISNTYIMFNNSSIQIYNKTMNSDDYYKIDLYQYYDYAHNINDTIIEQTPYILAKSETQVIISSTPNGKNHFYEIYKNSILPENHPDKNIYKTIKTYWYEVEGRDEKWKQEQIKLLGSIDKFNREYNLDFE